MESVAVLLVVGVLLVIGGSWLATKIGVAAPILLALVGIAGSLLPGQNLREIDPEWILAVVLPPILYAAAVNVPVTDFRRNLRAISGLSVILVVVSAVIVGLVLTWLLPGLPLAAGIAIGAVVAPPDAVAATSIGKKLGLPPRLLTVLEGEGLVNDATALVLLRSAVAAIGGAVTLTDTVTLTDVAVDFLFAVSAAIVIGLVVGLATVWARSRLDQPTLTTAISFTVPFLAFLPAQAIHASGVLSVVVAGLVTGVKSTRHFTAQDRISERMNWRTIQLLLENGVFLVMGYQLTSVVADVEHEHLSVVSAAGIGLLLCLLLVIVRAVFLIPLLFSLGRDQRRATGGWRGGVVLAWSGMRGVVTVAAAQTLPEDVPFRPQLVLIAFTVAVTTLVIHGTTLPALIRLLRLPGPDEKRQVVELRALIDEVVAAGVARLRSPDLRRTDGHPYTPPYIDAVLENRARVARNYAEQLASPIESEGAQSAALFRILLDAEQSALLDARASGRYSSDALEIAQRVIDTEIARTNPQGIG